MRAAYHSGAMRVSYDGKSVEYRDTAGMLAAIAALEAEIAATSGTHPTRVGVIRSDKGW